MGKSNITAGNPPVEDDAPVGRPSLLQSSIDSPMFPSISLTVKEIEQRIEVLKKTDAITSLTASRDATTVQEAISSKYGFVPTLAYCADLINFVEALTDG